MRQVILKSGRHPRIINGHPWVYGNEIEEVSAGHEEAHSIVEVFDSRKKFVGRGYYNPQSQIAVRLLTRKAGEQIDKEFFRGRIRRAFEYRQRMGYKENYRLVFGEGDFLPALIIDKLADVFVIQTLSRGMDEWKEEIVGVLQEEYQAEKIYERNDVPVRKLEGLAEHKGFLSGSFDTRFTINECGVKFWVDVDAGQKTGFFLDQKENRLLLEHICEGAEVLDCFCYTGSFSLFAARFGARHVTALDASADALALTKENVALNQFNTSFDYVTGNAFDLLPQWVKEKKVFDVIILDPPAFTKSRSGAESAARGYKEINLRAMKLLRQGGFLITFSCSHFMDPSSFFDVVSEAARDAGKTIRQVAYLQQAKDHPVVWNIPETNYLKGMVLQVI